MSMLACLGTGTGKAAMASIKTGRKTWKRNLRNQNWCDDVLDMVPSSNRNRRDRDSAVYEAPLWSRNCDNDSELDEAPP